MSKLDDILTPAMSVGSVAGGKSYDLLQVGKAKQQIKDLMLELIGNENDDMPQGVDSTCYLTKRELRQKVEQL